MDGLFILFLVMVFIIIPLFKKSSAPKISAETEKARKILAQKIRQASTLARNQVQNTENKKNSPFGHSKARSKTHQRQHDQVNAKVIPNTHAGREEPRDDRGRHSGGEMEFDTHRADNRGVVRANNKGRDDWGVRGDGRRGVSTPVIIFAGIVLAAAWFFFNSDALKTLGGFWEIIWPKKET